MKIFWWFGMKDDNYNWKRYFIWIKEYKMKKFVFCNFLWKKENKKIWCKKDEKRDKMSILRIGCEGMKIKEFSEREKNSRKENKEIILLQFLMKNKNGWDKMKIIVKMIKNE